MKKYIQRFLPSHEKIVQQRWLRPFRSLLYHHNLWYLNRRSVAGGVAVGLFCGLIPGPLQMLGAACLALLWRVNFPVAVLLTVYTNPLTIVPIYMLAYRIGLYFYPAEHSQSLLPPFPELHLHNWWEVLWQWLMTLGEPLFLGLLLLGSSLGMLGYVLVRLIWRVWVMWRWQHRRQLRIHKENKS